MFAKKTIAAGLIALTTVAVAVPASAASLSFGFGQSGPQLSFHDGRGHFNRDRWQRTLSPQEVRRVLRDRGYRNINYVDRRGSIYQVRATENGKRFGLVVNARSGEILKRYRIG